MASLVPAQRNRGRSHPILALAVLPLFLLSIPSAKATDGKAAKPAKPAWEWTLEERLAKRFDPEAIRARVAAKAAEETAFRKRLEAEGSSPLGDAKDSADWSRRSDLDVLTSRTNPELFLPGELFVHLLIIGFPPGEDDPSESRRTVEERAAALGFGSDLWERLRKVAAPVLEIERKREELAKTNPSAVVSKEGGEMDADDVTFCRLRAEALAKAEVEFGKEPFLRLLYEAAAPTETVYELYEGIAEHRRYLEGGCK